jgi:hypothetical protein
MVQFENPQLEPLTFDIIASVFTPTASFSLNKIIFNDIPEGKCASKIIKIINPDYKTAQWKISDIKTSSPLISAEYRPNDAEIICSLSGNATIGPIEEKIIVIIKQTKGLSQVEIPVVGQVVGPLKIVPAELFLGTLETNELYEGKFTIYSMKQNVSISPSSLPENCKLSVEKLRDNEYICYLKMKVPEDGGFLKGEILLETNLKQQPTLRIPFAGLVNNQSLK